MRREARSRRLAAGAVVVVVAAGVVLAGCDLIPKRSPGARLWRQRCAECHGVTGNGNTPQYMGNVKADLLDDRLAYKVRSKSIQNRSSEPERLDERVRDVAEYVLELKDVVRELMLAIAGKPVGK